MVEEAVRFGCPLPTCGVERRVLQRPHKPFNTGFDCQSPLPIRGCVVKVAYRAEDPEEAVQFGCPLPHSLRGLAMDYVRVGVSITNTISNNVRERKR